MKLIKGVVHLSDAVSFFINSEEVNYNDSDGNSIIIPLSLVVRLYEGSRRLYERRGFDWDSFCNDLFKDKNIESSSTECPHVRV